MGLGREARSKVTKRARFGCRGKASRAEASSRKSWRNSDSDRVRAALPAYSGTLRAKRSARGSARSSMRRTTNTVPAPPDPTGDSK
jgi:hypothetical protein